MMVLLSQRIIGWFLTEVHSFGFHVTKTLVNDILGMSHKGPSVTSERDCIRASRLLDTIQIDVE
jgi:hypothetical protein